MRGRPVDTLLYGQNVLLASDQPHLIHGFASVLERLGARILYATVEEAGGLAQQQTPSVAVLDCQAMSGETRALLRQLRRSAVPVVLHSLLPPSIATTERQAIYVAQPC